MQNMYTYKKCMYVFNIQYMKKLNTWAVQISTICGYFVYCLNIPITYIARYLYTICFNQCHGKV